MSLVVVSSSLPTRKYDSFLFLKELIMEGSTRGSGDGLPMQRSRVENIYWFHGWLSLLYFWGGSNEYEEFLGTFWLQVDSLFVVVPSQPPFTWSKLSRETLEQGMKNVQI